MLSKQTTHSTGGILPASVKPTHYHLNISDLEYGSSWGYCGWVNINATVSVATSEIILNSQNLDIIDAHVQECKESKDIEASTLHIDQAHGELHLGFPRDISAGDIVIGIKFRGTISDSMEGFYRAKYDPALPRSPAAIHDGQDSYMLVTHFEPCDARKAFPCFDEPHLKATFDLELELPKDQEALSNMPICTTSSGDRPDLKRVTFERTPVMSTYLLAWAVGDFEYVERITDKEHHGKKIPVRVYTAPGYSQYARFAVNHAAEILDYYANIFGVDYPLPKCDHMVVPEFISGAMENWGLITYRAPKILFDEKTSDNRVKLKACYVIAHELAHQWFGNLVTMQWWNELWLNEGFATWAGYLAVDHLYPDWKIWSHFSANVMSEAFSLDSLQATHPIDVPVCTSWGAKQMFDDISYFKGASVIRMISHHLGSDIFLAGITTYLKKHAFGTATTGDLFSTLEEASSFKVSQFMDSWIRRCGFPVVEPAVRGKETTYCQRRFLSFAAAESEKKATTWHIPLIVEGVGRAETVVMTSKQEVLYGDDHDKRSRVPIPCGSTFCHIKFSKEDLQKLLDIQSSLSSDTKIALLRDLRALTVAGEKSVGDLLSFCSSLQIQGDVFVLGEVIKCLVLLESTFSHNERISNGLLAYRNSLPVEQNFRVQWNIPTQDYLSIEYQRLCLQELLARRDKDILEDIEQRYSDWLAGNDTFSPSFLGTILGYAVSNFGQSAYDKVKARYMADTSVDGKEVCLSALGRIKEPRLVQEFLDFVFSDQMTLQNIHLAISALGNNGNSRELLWSYIKLNWEGVYERLSKSAVVLSWCIEMGLSHFDDMKVEREIVSFYASKDTTRFQRSLVVALDCIKRNAMFKERGENETLEWLESHNYR